MKPRWVVCEDGDEYVTRFERFLGGAFDFVPARDAAEALAACPAVDGVLLDLDFRRTPPERLVDENGAAAATLSTDARRRLAERQGILILALLRARGVTLPAVLCADIDDAAEAAWLAGVYAPLEIAPSAEGLAELAEQLRRLSRV